MIIIHGPDQLAAQNKLDQFLNSAKDKSLEITKIEAKDLTPANLSQLLTPSSLFSDSRLVVIDNLLSLLQSNNKKKLVEILKKTSNKNIILYENKNVHPATIKSLPTTQVFQFKENPLIFKLLDNLYPDKPKLAIDILNKIVESRQSLELLFFMLARHVRLLIQAKTPSLTNLPPWQLAKLNRQASLFTTDQLIALHHDLYQIDKRQKRSTIKSLESELILCILNI